MDKETIKDSENINSDEWKFLLLMMLMEDIKQKNSQWKSFEDELIYKNRFSVKHAVIDEIHECQANAVTIRKKDTVLYRARVFEKSNFNRLVKYYLQESGYSKSDIEKILNEWTDEQKILSLMPEIYSDYDYNQTPELVKAQKKWKRYVKYKGWNAEDSGAPPADLIGNGRANPDHIRYLYLSEDPVTFDIHDIESDEVVELPRLYNTIGAMFSRPYNGDASKYLSTQYIAEEIKNMGFDGLRFRSSLNKNGYNIVLFNPDDCIAVSSDLVEVKGIDLKLDEPMIYKVGTPKLKEEMTNLDWMK